MRDKSWEKEALFSMRAVTRMTGLSADTIRKWEERYGAVKPMRTEGNTRKFTRTDVRKLSLLQEITSRGYRIRDLAGLGEQRLQELLKELRRGKQVSTGRVEPPALDRVWSQLCEDYLSATRAFQVRRAKDLLSRAAGLLNPTDFVYQVALPILRQVGERWFQGKASPAHEHLVSVQIRSVLTTLLHWYAPQPGACKAVVTTPEGHLHELGVMMGALLALNQGYAPIYLGPSLPLKDIELALELSRAKLVLLSVLRKVNDAELHALVVALRRLSDKVETWVGLPADHRLGSKNTGAHYLTRFEDLDMALTQFGACRKL